MEEATLTASSSFPTPSEATVKAARPASAGLRAPPGGEKGRLERRCMDCIAPTSPPITWVATWRHIIDVMHMIQNISLTPCGPARVIREQRGKLLFPPSTATSLQLISFSIRPGEVFHSSHDTPGLLETPGDQNSRPGQSFRPPGKCPKIAASPAQCPP